MEWCIDLLCAAIAHELVRRMDLPEPVATVVEYAVCLLLQQAVRMLYISLYRA